MTPTPLHRLADDARSRLTERAAKADSALREELGSRIAVAGRVSVNMRPGALLAFFAAGRCLNAFELAESKAQKIGASLENLLRGQLKEWYGPRVEFEHLAGAGVHFHYGALNIGGMGCSRFGRLCVVDRRRMDETRPDPVWLAGDSLRDRWFHDAAGALLWAQVGDWVAPSDMALELATIKLAEDLTDARSLQERICGEADWIEALSRTPLDIASVEEIRSETDGALQERALAALLDGARPNEELDLELHDALRATADTLGIPWRQLRP